MECEFRRSLLEDISKTQGITNKLENVLSEIRSVIFPAAKFANASKDFRYRIMTGAYPVGEDTIPATVRVAEVPEKVILCISPPGFTPGGQLRGLTLYDYGKVLLNKHYWCIETLIHETLHSVSIFGQRQDLIKSYRQLIEGLTECLTGFLLYSKYNYSYANCFNNPERVCRFTYPYETRIWTALCHVISIKDVTSIYFWNDDCDFETLFEKFTLKIKSDFPKFKNVLREQSKLPVMSRLHQQCGSNLGETYSRAFRSMQDRLDFSQIKS